MKVLKTARGPLEPWENLNLDHVTQEYVDALNTVFDAWPDGMVMGLTFAAGELSIIREDVEVDPESYIGKTVTWLPDQQGNRRRAVALVDGGVLVSVPGTASTFVVVPAAELRVVE